MHNRALSVFAATLAALALAGAPAFAGENDDDGDDDDSAPQVQNVPAPASGGSAPASAPRGGVATGLGGTAPDGNGALILSLASGGLLLTGAGGVLVARRRMS